MRDIAMPVDIGRGAAEPGDSIKIRCIGGQHHDSGSARREVPESSPGEKQTDQRVREIVQPEAYRAGTKQNVDTLI